MLMITKEETLKKLNEIDNDFRKKINQLNTEHIVNKRYAMNEWAKDNARFNIGILYCKHLPWC